MSVQKSSFLLREIDIFRPFLKSTSMWLKMAPCLPKFGLTRPREASRWLQIDPGGSKMVALQFRPMLFTESFLPSVTSDLQCCCSSTPRKGTTASPIVSVKGSRIGPIAFVLGSGWVRMSLKIISSWPQEAPEQSVAKAPLDHAPPHPQPLSSQLL